MKNPNIKLIYSGHLYPIEKHKLFIMEMEVLNILEWLLKILDLV